MRALLSSVSVLALAAPPLAAYSDPDRDGDGLSE